MELEFETSPTMPKKKKKKTNYPVLIRVESAI